MTSDKNSIIAWFIRNPVAANLLMALIIVAGTLTAITIRKEFLPEIATGEIEITIAYPGASPSSVEEGVCMKVEEALSGITGIKRIRSAAHEGIGNMVVELENSADPDERMNVIRAAVNGIDTFPDLVKRPLITKKTTKDGVLWLILAGAMDEGQAKSLAQHIKEDLLALGEIRQVEIHGVRDNEIAIEVSDFRLRQYGLTLHEVTEAVQRRSLDLPGGAVKSVGGEILVRTVGQARNGMAFSDLVIRSNEDGERVTLGQIADIRDGFDESEWFLNYQGKPAIGLQVFRVGDQSTLDVATAARRYQEKKLAHLPKGIHLSIMADTSLMLKDRLKLMVKNLCSGAVLVFVALVLFLQIRVAFWVMLGIPVSFLGAIWLMPAPFIDGSINMITLFGCILVIGILVDDAIVIGENIHTTVLRDGQSVESVIRGARQVAIPATFGVLTTMASFIPILMIPGINGKIWRGIALVVIACLFFSLVESKWILPAHLAHTRLRSGNSGGKKRRSFFNRLQGAVNKLMVWTVRRVYRPLSDKLLEWRYSTLAIFIGLLVITVVAMDSNRIRVVFFPDIEEDFVLTQLTMAAGTPAGQTMAATRQIEKAAKRVNASVRRETGVNADVIKHIISWSKSENEVLAYAELLPSEERPLGSMEIIKQWRRETGDIPGATDLEFTGTAAEAGSPIHFELVSRNPAQLKAAAAALKKKLGTFEGVYDIKDSQVQGKSEIKLVVQSWAEHMGITTEALARQVRNAFYGEEAQTLQRGQNEVKVIVRYPRSERRSLFSLRNMRIRTSEGKDVPLEAVADIVMEKSPSVVERIDGRRVIHVMANVDKASSEPGSIIKEIKTHLMPELSQRYPGLRFDLGGEAREQRETLTVMGRGAVFALFAVYALMAIPLRSYLQPLIIMAAIPFGIVGAIGGHWLMGLPVSILSICGMVALAGVVVNDSLVMASFINEQRRAGVSLDKAVREAGAARFRAILLTSVTTFCGLLPLLMERSIQAQYLIPMAASLAFGILFATVITLILIPTLYLIGADINQRRLRIFVKSGPHGTEMVPVTTSRSVS